MSKGGTPTPTPTATTSLVDGSIWTLQDFGPLARLVAIDLLGAVYRRSTADASKVWVRGFSGALDIRWFGGVADWDGARGTDNLPALLAAMQFQQNTALNMTLPVLLGIGKYYISSTWEIQRVCHFIGCESGADESSATGIGGTSIVSPTNVCTARIHSSNTTGATTQAGNAAQSATGTILEGICFEQAALGNDLTAHGVWMRATATLRRCSFRNIAGNAVHNVANAAGAGALRGDTSQWRVENCLVYSCGGDGLHTNGQDANAGTCFGFVTKDCGGCGIYDTGTFGSTYLGYQITGYGGTNGHVAGVYNAGRIYQLIASVEIGEGLGSTTTPGTNQQVWYDLGTAGGASTQFPQWVSGNTYTLHSPLHFSGYSNSSLVLGGYVEGGNTIAHAEAPTQVSKGFNTWTNVTSALAPAGSGSPNALVSPTGIGAYKKSSGTTQITQFGGYQFTVLGAGNANSSDYSPDILAHYRDLDGVNFHWGYDAGADPLMYYSGRKYILGYSGPSTTRTFGRSTVQPDYAMLFDFALIDPTNSANARVIGIRSAAPTTGNHAQGQVVLNVAPVLGGNIGWVCVSGGTPGTWLPFGIAGGAQAATSSATYTAPAGGTTIDTEGRASLAQLAADLADIKSKLQTGKLMA